MKRLNVQFMGSFQRTGILFIWKYGKYLCILGILEKFYDIFGIGTRTWSEYDNFIFSASCFVTQNKRVNIY